MSGELVSSDTCEECACEMPHFPCRPPRPYNTLQKVVIRKAADKGRVVLEGVKLDSDTIDACFSKASGEATVQARLVKWKNGKGH